MWVFCEIKEVNDMDMRVLRNFQTEWQSLERPAICAHRGAVTARFYSAELADSWVLYKAAVCSLTDFSCTYLQVCIQQQRHQQQNEHWAHSRCFCHNPQNKVQLCPALPLRSPSHCRGFSSKGEWLPGHLHHGLLYSRVHGDTNH